MQIKTGIDLVHVPRIVHSMQNPRFLERFFSPAERELFESRGNSPNTVAANYAAKEAFGKALGTGISGFALSEVAALRDEHGAPYLELSGAAAELAEGTEFSVSLSHDGDYACAVVVGIRK